MTTVFIISAPAGSGKSTLVKAVLEWDPSIRFSISCTTRPPRGQERPGESYHYLRKAEFLALIARNAFLEFARVFGYYYGTRRDVLEEARAAGCDLLLDIDVQGARQLKDRIRDAVTIFVLAPSRKELEQRLRDRSEDSEEVIGRRLRAAAREIRDYQLYDYVIVNDQIETSVETLKSIIRAERARRSRIEEQILPILKTFEL